MNQPERRAGAAMDAALKTPTRADLLLYSVARNILVGFAGIYWRVRFEGLGHVPAGGPFVAAATHRSNIDFAIVSGITRRRVRYIGKESLWKSRLLGGLISALGAFPVHRGTTDRESMRRCIAILERGEPLVIFPEGTRKSGPTIEGLQDGAVYMASRAQVPILPIAIGGSERALRKGQYVPRPVKVHVVVGPPIPPPPVVDGKRPSRRALREHTERLQAELQVLFDAAEVRAGVSPR